MPTKASQAVVDPGAGDYAGGADPAVIEWKETYTGHEATAGVFTLKTWPKVPAPGMKFQAWMEISEDGNSTSLPSKNDFSTELEAREWIVREVQTIFASVIEALDSLTEPTPP